MNKPNLEYISYLKSIAIFNSLLIQMFRTRLHEVFQKKRGHKVPLYCLEHGGSTNYFL